jgi:dihydropyrimidinase
MICRARLGKIWSMGLLIRNGTVVSADKTFAADILIEGEAIREVRSGIPAEPAHQTMDATGMLLLPGGIDAHTHLDMPFGGTTSSDDFETGTRAAAIGGTTTLVDFAIQARGTKMRDALDIWWKKAESKACIDYGLHMIVTDLPEAGLEDMDDMVREGVASFKLFMAYPNVLMVDDATIFRALQQTSKNGALICMHAENGSVIDVIVRQALAEGKTAPIYHALTRPTVAEAEAVHRAIAMAEIAGVPIYIVHLSSEDALNQVREARDRGLPAFAETCPQYLLLSIDNMKAPGFEGAKYVFTPPLREKQNLPKLWDGLKTDHLQVVSTDHCPFCFEDQKALGKDDFTKIPNGGPGIENRLQLLHHHGVNAGKITLNRFVEIVSTAPARIFGMYPKKGAIAPGSDADIVVWDPKAEHVISAKTHHMRVDYSMFEGFKVTGNARQVFSRGELIVDKGQYIGRAGRGQYLRRAAKGGAWN